MSNEKPNIESQSIVMDYEKEIPFLKENHYLFMREDDDAYYYGKMVRASAQMNTPMGVFNVVVGETALFIRRERLTNKYRFGIVVKDQQSCSDEFTETEFQAKIQEFEEKLNVAN